MRYKEGDRVRIKSIDWYNENKGNADKTNSVWCADGGVWFFYHMSQYCGKIMTIENVWANSYTLEGSDSRWTDEMIEGLVEEETLIERVDDNGLPFNEWLSHKGAFYIPDGYELKDENGNVINAKKIVLEKKKKEYPKSYKESLEMLDYKTAEEAVEKAMLLSHFERLLVCRDAYWKIAGEKMGLGKSWKPDWLNDDVVKHIISHDGKTYGTRGGLNYINYILAFPTEEMRDAFYENFKELINECKELL